MKYMKLPIVIEAIEWKADSRQEEDPKWLSDAIERGEVTFKNFGFQTVEMVIYTLEGPITASYGDYIIQGVAGELYPCKPDIFEKTYKLVD